MMDQPPRLHLFQGYGVELEYMLVDRDTLQVKPLTDELLKAHLGNYGSDFENGLVTWSNELVLHVVELKSTQPKRDFVALEKAFAGNIRQINESLQAWNAVLMPGAAHPFMNPASDTRLWPHDNNEVYEIYNRIFDCRGHGWSNLQSTHLNLPFYDDEEFAKLHAAVRLILPLLPALCASSPVLDSKPTGMLDTRLMYYKTNQARLPCITGRVIPEAVFSKRNYVNIIYERIKADIAPYDPEQILHPVWVNSRGAIPRFDRGSIEIRIMDIQECPAADLAIVTLVIETLKALVNGEFIDYDAQVRWKTDGLAMLLDRIAAQGQAVVIDQRDYLDIFQYPGSKATAGELWQHIVERVLPAQSPEARWRKEIAYILNYGPLAARILKALGSETSRESIAEVYKRLPDCLARNAMFEA